MKVYKFGGASVKDADGVLNLSNIVSQKLVSGDVVVVSAMGKTTARLEELACHHLDSGKASEQQLSDISADHLRIVDRLFPETDEHSVVRQRIISLFDNIRHDLDTFPTDRKKAFLDRILSYGEILSTVIVSEYLQFTGLSVRWKDIRKYIRSDDTFGSAKVEWVTSLANLGNGLPEPGSVVVTQGYIASTAGGMTTTLGKEGSDFTAAIIARACNAENVTFWKDVAGVFSADPKKVNDAVLLRELSYREVVELTYYGAKIIHPKTMGPLAKADIPLYVRSFLDYEKPGTRISGEADETEASQVIFKHDQVLVSFKIDNLEFIGESNIGLIFYTFDRLDIQVSIMQSSASSFTFAFDWDEDKMDKLIAAITPMEKFSMYFNKGLTLATFKNLAAEKIASYLDGKTTYLQQTTRSKVRILYKE